MINVTKRLLRHSAINPERVLLEWVSAAEAVRFADVVTSFTDALRDLGPLSADAHQNGKNQQLRLKAALNASNSEKLRWVAAKQTEFMKDGNRYGEVFTAHETGRFLDGVIVEEMIIQQILLLLQEQPLSVADLAGKIAVAPNMIFSFVMSLARKKMVEVARVRGRDPMYQLNNQAA